MAALSRLYVKLRHYPLHLTRTVKGETEAETLSSPAARFLICLSFLLDIAPLAE